MNIHVPQNVEDIFNLFDVISYFTSDNVQYNYGIMKKRLSKTFREIYIRINRESSLPFSRQLSNFTAHNDTDLI